MIDLSRHVNKSCKKEKVKLAHFLRCLEITEKGDWQAVLDLEKAYFHIRIADEHVKYLGIKHVLDGQQVTLAFQFLPFGLASAVHCITKMFKPIVAELHGRGIRYSQFIDDGRVVAGSREECQQHYGEVIMLLENCGWQLARDKSDKMEDVSQIKPYLGFIIDSSSMIVTISGEKIQRFRTALTGILGVGPQKVKEVASITGMMESFRPAFGPIVQICARSSFGWIARLVDGVGWQGSGMLEEECKAELRFFEANLEFFHGYPAQTPSTEVSVVSIIGPPEEFLSKHWLQGHLVNGTPCVWASDASAFGTYAYSIKGPAILDASSNFTETEMGFSSGLRELLAVIKALPGIAKAKPVGEDWHIYWLTDSTNLVSFLTKGSGKRHIQPYVFHVARFCRANNLCITPIHLRRGDDRIMKADAGSRNNASDDWGVDRGCFETFNTLWKFTIDLFASSVSAKTERFYALETQDTKLGEGALGVNAFCHDWSGEVAWVCPSVSVAIATIRKIRKTENLRGILILPEWKSAGFWNLLFKGESLLSPFYKREKRRPYLVQFQGVTDTALYGHTDFFMLFLHFDTKL